MSSYADVVRAVKKLVKDHLETKLSDPLTCDKFIKFCITSFVSVDHETLQVVNDIKQIDTLIEQLAEKYGKLKLLNKLFTPSRIVNILENSLTEINNVFNEFNTKRDTLRSNAKHAINSIGIKLINKSDSETLHYIDKLSDLIVTGHKDIVSAFGKYDVSLGHIVEELSHLLWKEPDINNAIAHDILTKNLDWEIILGSIEYYNTRIPTIIGQKNQKIIPKNILPFVNIPDVKSSKFVGYHRSGWQFVIDNLSNLNNSNSPVLFDTYLDRTFGWNYNFNSHKQTIPYTQPWIGVIHHAANLNTPNNVITMFNKPKFLESLHTCLGLITLSENSRNDVLILLKQHHKGTPPDVISISHPTEGTNQLFNISEYNKNMNLVQIGSWLRMLYPIYALDVSDLKMNKQVLVGKGMHDIMPTVHNGELIIGPNSSHIEHSKGSVNNVSINVEQIIININVTINIQNFGPICRLSNILSDITDSLLVNTLQGDSLTKVDIVQQAIENKSTNQNLSNHSLSRLENKHKEKKYVFEEVHPGFNFNDIKTNRFLDETYDRAIELGATYSGKHLHMTNYTYSQLLHDIKSVSPISHLSDQQYDTHLTNSVVFLCLLDASAVNTVNECIVRNTPVLVNRLPSLEEVLGKHYPMFYTYDPLSVENTVESASHILNIPNIVKTTHNYMQKINKEKFTIQYFIKKLLMSNIGIKVGVYNKLYALFGHKPNFNKIIFAELVDVLSRLKINGVSLSESNTHINSYTAIVNDLTKVIEKNLVKQTWKL
jgi:hypothetical protein